MGTNLAGEREGAEAASNRDGLMTVGVLWGMGDADELAEADHLVATAEQLVELLAQPERLMEREA